jgi:AcrR family transcriptional regulator
MEPRDGILKAAQVVFARHGFRQTAMAMVAEEAGLSRQALYHHFASKEALFAGLVDDLHEAALDASKAAVAKSAPSAADAIASVMLAYHKALVSRVAGSPYAAELIEESGRLCGAAVSAFGKRFEKDLEGVVATFVRDGRFKLRGGVSPRDLIEMVQVAAKGVKVVHAGESEAKYAQALKRMIDVICAGVEAPGSVSSAKQTKAMGTARRIAR